MRVLGCHGMVTQVVKLTRNLLSTHAFNPMQPAEAQPYNYVGCNPVNATDPTGAISAACVQMVILTVAGVALDVGTVIQLMGMTSVAAALPALGLGLLTSAIIGMALGLAMEEC